MLKLGDGSVNIWLTMTTGRKAKYPTLAWLILQRINLGIDAFKDKRFSALYSVLITQFILVAFILVFQAKLFYFSLKNTQSVIDEIEEKS